MKPGAASSEAWAFWDRGRSSPAQAAFTQGADHRSDLAFNVAGEGAAVPARAGQDKRWNKDAGTRPKTKDHPSN